MSSFNHGRLSNMIAYVCSRIFKSRCFQTPMRWKSTYKPIKGSALLRLSERNSADKNSSGPLRAELSVMKLFTPMQLGSQFGIAKDKSPKKATKETIVIEETPIRYDELYMKDMEIRDREQLNRNYKQTWREFPENRVRPVTEWGYSMTNQD